jgi:hypothetical protein
MRFLSVSLTWIVLGGLLVSCSDNTHETTRLSSLQPILFDGRTQKSIQVESASSQQVQASCDKTTNDILVSQSASGPFSSVRSYPNTSLSALIESCRKSGTFNLDIFTSNILAFTKGVKGNKVLFFQAASGSTFSTVSQLTVAYNPAITLAHPVGFSVNAGSGIASGTNVKLEYQIGKPVPNAASGTNIKVIPVND